MGQIVTDKPVDFEQFADEVGGPVWMVGEGRSDRQKRITAPGMSAERLTALVEAHVPTADDPDRALAIAIEQASTMDELKAALLGHTAPARVAAQGKSS